MRIILLITLTFLLNNSISQTIIAYDYMETYNWGGYWLNATNVASYTNASVSSDRSTVLFGNGTGTSTIEDNFYRMPNISGLDATKQYQFRFRLGSYTFTSPSAATKGVDGPDYVSVLVSTNGGAYVTELRITGNGNATWPYNTTGTIMHTANGVFSTSAPNSDVYQSPSGASGILSNGPSVITLDLPMGITQVAIDIYCRVNAAGEEWWLDNIELVEIEPISLPIELMYFSANLINENHGLIEWSTASEHNNDYFIVEKSNDGVYWGYLTMVYGQGNSTEKIDYRVIDNNIGSGITYYRLTQVDYDGKYEVFDNMIQSIKKSETKNIIKITNLLGHTIDENYEGIVIIYYGDNTIEKKYNKKLD